MENCIDTINYKGYIIKIYPDELLESPREWDNLGTMICLHSNYELGDKHDLTSDMFNGWDELEEYLVKELGAKVILPLYLYDHSGITMNTIGFQCPWDSGQVGFIYVDAEKIKEEFDVKRISKELIVKVTTILQDEVEVYDQCLRGDVYGYNIYSEARREEFGGCWGFYGHDFDENGLMEAAKDKIDDDLDANGNIEDQLHFEALLAKNCIARSIKDYIKEAGASTKGAYIPAEYIVERLKDIERYLETKGSNQPNVEQILKSELDI